MNIRNTNWLKKYISWLMRKKGFVFLHSETIWRYMLFVWIRRDNKEIQARYKWQDLTDEAIEENCQITKFFVSIEKYIPWYVCVMDDKIIQKEIEMIKNKIIE